MARSSHLLRVKTSVFKFIRRNYGRDLSFYDCELNHSATNQMRAIEQYFRVVLLFMEVYKLLLTFASVDESLACDHSSASYRGKSFWQMQFVFHYSQNEVYIPPHDDSMLTLKALFSSMISSIDIEITGLSFLLFNHPHWIISVPSCHSLNC